MRIWRFQIGALRALGYTVAAGGTVAFFLLRWMAQPWIDGQAALTPFVLVVFAAAGLGGLRPGLLATALAGLGHAFYFSPRGSLWIASPAEAAMLASFVLTGALVSWGCEALAVAARKEVTERERLHLALRESEARLRLATEATGMGVFDVDYLKDKISWSEAAKAMFGLPLDVEVTALTVLAAVHPEDREEVVRATEQSWNPEGEGVFRVEHRVVWPDGSVHWIAARGRAIFADEPAGRRAVRHVGIMLDITQRKTTEEDLADAARRKDEFLALLGHELRNPLTPIRTGIEILRAASKGQPILEQTTSMMERQIVQMVRLTDDLLDVSRGNQGKLQLQRRTMTLIQAIETAVEAVRPLIDDAGQRLAVRVPADPVFLHADPARIAQVLTNLLNNASKFTDPGGRISLSLSTEEEWAVIRVSDTGIGIPEEALGGIFDLFSQADRSIERSRGGLGIGLHLVKRLAELHGGQVEAQSAGPGRGSEFTVRLPLASSETGEDSPLPQLSRTTTALRVLVIDDQRDVADSMQIFLEQMGYEARAVYDGPTALEALADCHAEVVLCDIGMPGMSGLELAGKVRENCPQDTLLIAISGYGTEAEIQRSLAAGFDLHLVKPVDPSRLRQVLGEARKPTGKPN